MKNRPQKAWAGLANTRLYVGVSITRRHCINLKLKRRNARLSNYPYAALMFPVLTLGNGFWEIGVLSATAFTVLFYFDPVFKFYRSKVPNFQTFMLCSFLLGMSLATIAFFIPEHSGKVLSLWGLPTLIGGLIIVKQQGKLQYK
tara:strand:+ start:108 stop:539 length:432 start_codon:yes stop_codon:yes gene_type:complete